MYIFVYILTDKHMSRAHIPHVLELICTINFNYYLVFNGLICGRV